MPDTEPNHKAKFIAIQLVLATLLVAGATAYVAKNPISTIFKAGTQEKEVTISFHPNELEATPGNTINITPFLSAKAKKPEFIMLTLSYDGDQLTFVGADDTHLTETFESIVPSSDTTKNNSGNNTRLLRLTYAIKDPANSPGESIELSKLTFTVLGTKQNVMRLDRNNSQIVFANDEVAELLTEDVRINFPNESKNDTENQPTSEVTQPIAEPTTLPTQTVKNEPTTEPITDTIPIITESPVTP